MLAKVRVSNRVQIVCSYLLPENQQPVEVPTTSILFHFTSCLSFPQVRLRCNASLIAPKELVRAHRQCLFRLPNNSVRLL